MRKFAASQEKRKAEEKNPEKAELGEDQSNGGGRPRKAPGLQMLWSFKKESLALIHSTTAAEQRCLKIDF